MQSSLDHGQAKKQGCETVLTHLYSGFYPVKYAEICPSPHLENKVTFRLVHLTPHIYTDPVLLQIYNTLGKKGKDQPQVDRKSYPDLTLSLFPVLITVHFQDP